jgi:hypothetical protein
MEKSSSLQGFGSLAEAVNSLVVPKFDASNYDQILIRRAALGIATTSRRGTANFVYSPKPVSTPDNIFVNISSKFDRTILCYQGSTEFDRTILEQDGTYYIHPDADKMAVELIF